MCIFNLAPTRRLTQLYAVISILPQRTQKHSTFCKLSALLSRCWCWCRCQCQCYLLTQRCCVRSVGGWVEIRQRSGLDGDDDGNITMLSACVCVCVLGRWGWVRCWFAVHTALILSAFYAIRRAFLTCSLLVSHTTYSLHFYYIYNYKHIHTTYIYTLIVFLISLRALCLCCFLLLFYAMLATSPLSLRFPATVLLGHTFYAFTWRWVYDKIGSTLYGWQAAVIQLGMH